MGLTHLRAHLRPDRAGLICEFQARKMISSVDFLLRTPTNANETAKIEGMRKKFARCHFARQKTIR